MTLSQLKQKALNLKTQIYILYFISKDPRLPLYLKLLAILVTAYAFSPIDLIPDFIPIIGILDDLLILPFGIALVIYLTPDEIIQSAKEKAACLLDKPVNYQAAFVIILIWLVLLFWLIKSIQPTLFSN